MGDSTNTQQIKARSTFCAWVGLWDKQRDTKNQFWGRWGIQACMIESELEAMNPHTRKTVQPRVLLASSSFTIVILVSRRLAPGLQSCRRRGCSLSYTTVIMLSCSCIPYLQFCRRLNCSSPYAIVIVAFYSPIPRLQLCRSRDCGSSCTIASMLPAILQKVKLVTCLNWP